MVMAPNGTDWLFFSAGTSYHSGHYAIGVARCAGPLGGCHDVSTRPFIASDAQGAGPGEETIFEASDHSAWVLYNPWYAGNLKALLRPVEAARIGWGAKGPYLAQAGRFPLPSSPRSATGDRPSGRDEPATALLRVRSK